MRMRILVIAVVMLLGACKKKSAPKPPPAPATIRIWTDAELATLEASLMKRLDETGKRTCVRPVLRGSSVGGKASEKLVALSEPTGELAECLHDVEIAEQGDKLAELVEQRAPHILAIEKRCGAALELAVAAAVRHDDACTPYQVGVRVEPSSGKNLIPIMRAARMLGLRGRLRVESGDVAGGLWLLLDSVRTMQDFGRGQTNLIVSMVATAGEKIVVEQIQGVLSTTAIRPTVRSELDAALDLLIASEPPFGDTLRGELDYMALHTGLARMKPKSWAVPGGRMELTRNDEPDNQTKLSASDEAAMMLTFAERLYALYGPACPVTASFEACTRQLANAIEKVRTQKPPLTGPVQDIDVASQLANTLGTKSTAEAIETGRQEIQRMVVESLVIQSSGDYHRFAAKRAYTVARLAAARVHLAAQGLGRCPTQAELDSPRFMALRKPAALGDALVPERTKTHLLLHAPKWAIDDRNKAPVSSIRCR